MDPIKTGEWIAARRKEKELTQKDLAARLGVTDKAISRWETGKGYPDISLLPALAEELGCTVNELLSGKRLSPEEAPAAAEENMKALCRTAGQPSSKAGMLAESRVEIQEDRIVIRRSLWYIIVAIIALWLSVLAGNMIYEALPRWEEWHWELGTVLEMIVLSFWFLLSLGFAASAIFIRSCRLILDREGVTLRSLLRTKRISWDHLRDYGVAYFVHDRDHVLYSLYFADIELEYDDIGRKRIPHSAVSFDLQDTLLDRYVVPIMDFCAEQTDVLPFLVYPYDRLRFQSSKPEAVAAPQAQPLRDKPGRRLLALAFAVLLLGLGFPVLDRFMHPQDPDMVLRLIGAGIALLGGLFVLWKNLRRLRRENSRVEEFDWTCFLVVLTVALLSVALGVLLTVLAFHSL